MTTYEPDWQNADVQRRLAKALSFAKHRLSTERSTRVHSTELTDALGHQSRPLGRYLRANLLMQTGKYIVGKQSFSYSLSERGYDKLMAHLSVELPAPSYARHPDLLNLEFHYSDKSNRLWHPLQNIKRVDKTDFWATRLPHNYDIDAAAPTILLQLAERHGLARSGAVKDYLANKSADRRHVANVARVSVHDAKRLINSLFNGARLAKNDFCASYATLGWDSISMDRLQMDEKVMALRAGIKEMWEAIEDGLGQKLTKGAAKWGIYFHYERVILDVIVDELRRDGIKHFTEHDGFRAEREISSTWLEEVVYEKTGFRIKLSKELVRHTTTHTPTANVCQQRRDRNPGPPHDWWVRAASLDCR